MELIKVFGLGLLGMMLIIFSIPYSRNSKRNLKISITIGLVLGLTLSWIAHAFPPVDLLVYVIIWGAFGLGLAFHLRFVKGK